MAATTGAFAGTKLLTSKFPRAVPTRDAPVLRSRQPVPARLDRF